MNAEIQKHTRETQERTRRELCTLALEKAAGTTKLAWARKYAKELIDAEDRSDDDPFTFIDKTYRPMAQKHKALLAEWEKCNAKYEALTAMTFSLPYIGATQASGTPLTKEGYVAGLIEEAQRVVDVSSIKTKIAPIEFEPKDCNDKPAFFEPGSIVTMKRGNPYGRGHNTEWRTLVLVLKRVLIPGTDSLECVVCYFNSREDNALTFEVVDEEYLLGGPKDARFMEKFMDSLAK